MADDQDTQDELNNASNLNTSAQPPRTPTLRAPLPQIGPVVSPDSLRQFYLNGIPQYRLPAVGSGVAGSTTQIVVNTVINKSTPLPTSPGKSGTLWSDVGVVKVAGINTPPTTVNAVVNNSAPLPTSPGAPGTLWNDAGVVKVA